MTIKLCDLEERNKRHELSSATAASRLAELTALQQAAEDATCQLRQRNEILTDQLSQLQQQVSDDDDDDADVDNEYTTIYVV